MDLIQNLMDKESVTIISELTGQGFSAEQASGFLPEALASLVQSLKGANFADLSGSANLTSMLDTVDITGLASRTGVDSSMAKTGLNAVIPHLLAFVQENQGLTGLLGEKVSGLTSAFRRLHH
ncbi:MAG: hypothetical protein ABF290_10685 [Thiogranum sp.]